MTRCPTSRGARIDRRGGARRRPATTGRGGSAGDGAVGRGGPGRRAGRRASQRRAAAVDAPRHGGEAARPARCPAARRRRPHPRSSRSTTSWSPTPASGSTQLVERLPRQVLDQYMRGLSDAIKSVTPDDLAANREMVRDLNRLLQDRLDGGDPDVSDVPRAARPVLPGRPQSLDDIIEQLAERMAAMQSLLRSMSRRAARRAPVDDGCAAARRSPALGPRPARGDARPAAARRPGRAAALQRRRAARPRRRAAADGRTSSRWTRSRSSSTGSGRPGDLGEVDRDQLRDLLGEPTGRDLDALDDLARQLETGGLPRAPGRPAGADAARDAGASARRCSTTCSAGCGGTRSAATGSIAAGRGGEREETTKPYEFGDPFHLDLNRTLANALAARGERVGPRAREGRRPAPRTGRLRGLPDRAADADVDRAPRGHEPVDAAARLLRGRQEGRDRAEHADPDRVPARPPVGHRVRVLRPRDPARDRSRSCRGTATSTARTSSTG